MQIKITPQVQKCFHHLHRHTFVRKPAGLNIMHASSLQTGQVINNLIIWLLLQHPPFTLPACYVFWQAPLPLYLLYEDLCCWLSFFLSFFLVVFHAAAECFVSCVHVTPSPPLSKHLEAAAGFLRCSPSSGCRSLRIVVNSACVLVMVVGERGRGSKRELMPPGCWRMITTDPPPGSVGMQIECPPLVSAQPPPPHYPQPTDTHTHVDSTCTHAHLISGWHIYPWKRGWHNFSTSLCVIVLLPSPSSPRP